MAGQAGLRLCSSQTPEDRFSCIEAHMFFAKIPVSEYLMLNLEPHFKLNFTIMKSSIHLCNLFPPPLKHLTYSPVLQCS